MSLGPPVIMPDSVLLAARFSLLSSINTRRLAEEQGYELT